MYYLCKSYVKSFYPAMRNIAYDILKIEGRMT